MSSVARAHEGVEARSDVKTTDLQAPHGGLLAHPGTILQRAKAEPRSLTPRDVLGLQGSIGNRATRQFLRGTSRGEPIQRKQNNTGLPDGLKSGVESLSGLSMDDVSVHYNSDKPHQAHARAFTQGTDIYVAPGEESTVPHEAWHVVQQKEGRVKPSFQMKGFDVNVDSKLETEADVMGAKAANLSSVASRLPSASAVEGSARSLGQTVQRSPVRQFEGLCGPRDPTLIDVPRAERNTVEEVFGGRASHPFSEDEREELEGIAESGEIKDIKVAGDILKKRGGTGRRVIWNWIRMRPYRVSDPDAWFYTAKSQRVWEAIQDLNNPNGGLDPSRGGKRNLQDVKTIPDWNSRGHIYFCLSPIECAEYAELAFKDQPWVILKFHLPAGTEIQVDPEIKTGFRTKTFVPRAGLQEIQWNRQTEKAAREEKRQKALARMERKEQRRRQQIVEEEQDETREP